MTFHVFLFFGAFIGMEGVAFLAHKHLMHGPLWILHRSHHVPTEGPFQANDLFAVFFATPAIVCIYFGTHGSLWLLPVGLGMTAYGAAYFLVHDVVVHRRLPFPFALGGYLRAVTRAHLIHHKTLTREGASSFGFLYPTPRPRA